MPPGEDKTTLPFPDSGNVTLTLDEYDKLVELATKPPKKSDLAPLPYSAKHADLSLHVDNDAVLDTGLPLRIEAGRASFSLPAPAAGSVQLALVIPGDHTYANIHPGIITSRKSENGHTAIEATLVPGQPANIWWATREAVTPTVPREVRFLSDTKSLISVSEAEMRVAVLADITVVQGEPSQFQVEVPEGFEVTGATGATLDSTEMNSGVLTLKVNA